MARDLTGQTGHAVHVVTPVVDVLVDFVVRVRHYVGYVASVVRVRRFVDYVANVEVHPVDVVVALLDHCLSY